MVHKNTIHTDRGPFSLKRWQEALALRGLGGEIVTKYPDDFCVEGLFCIHERAGFTGFFNFPAHIYQKARAACAQDTQNFFLISLIRAGSAYVEQGRNSALLKKGDCYVRLMSNPFYVAYSEGYKSVSLAVSEEAVRQWLAAPENLTASSLQQGSRWGVALTASLKALTYHSFDGTVVPATAVTEQILCLLALTANQTEDMGTSYKKDVINRLREEMREHLADSDFTPSRLASSTGLPRRTMYAAFASVSSSFGRELALMRLQKARACLERSCLDKKSISEIGRMVGYKNTSLFITRFRQMFGTTPDAYRRIKQS